MKYLFLDTNIYLHYKDYDQIDWGKILQTPEDITIVVPHIISSEIDKIKNKGEGKVSNRARAIAKRFTEVFLDNKQRNTSMIVCDAPKSNEYEEYGLDKDIADNQLVLSAILFQKTSQCDVWVISGDTNPLITAKNNGLKFLRLQDEYRLKPELSKEEKEFIQTKKELEQYKNRLSKPCLTFENHESFLKLKKPILDDVDSDIQAAIANERSHVSQYQKSNIPSDNMLYASMGMPQSLMEFFLPIPEEIERYNKEVCDYHKEFEEYIRSKFNRKIFENRLFELSLIISNYGNAPTGDLEIYLYFPDHINLYNETCKKSFDVNTPPVKPVQPSNTKSLIDREMIKTAQFNQEISPFMFSMGCVDNRPRIWDLEISLKKHEYHFSRKPLPQTLHYDIEWNHGIYIDLMQCGNFRIEYSIVDTSLPKPIEGTLNVIVE